MSVFVRNPRHLDALKAVLAPRIVSAADKVTARVKKLLGQPGSGIHHPGNPNPSSAPGDPPASQAGDLAASQTTRGPFINDRSVSAASGSDDPKSFWLNVGTANTAPRPYMLRAMLESKGDILESLASDGPLDGSGGVSGGVSGGASGGGVVSGGGGGGVA